jgi:hypothetical protein
VPFVFFVVNRKDAKSARVGTMAARIKELCDLIRETSFASQGISAEWTSGENQRKCAGTSVAKAEAED